MIDSSRTLIALYGEIPYFEQRMRLFDDGPVDIQSNLTPDHEFCKSLLIGFFGNNGVDIITVS